MPRRKLTRRPSADRRVGTWIKRRLCDDTVGRPDDNERKRVPWQRLALSLIGITIIIFLWRWATFHLYTLPPTSIVAFTSITVSTMYSVAFLVAFFVTGQAWTASWTNATSASADVVAAAAKQIAGAVKKECK